jgi:hypothetical protein
VGRRLTRNAVYAPERRGYQPTQSEPSRIKLPKGASPTVPTPSPPSGDGAGNNGAGNNDNNNNQ